MSSSDGFDRTSSDTFRPPGGWPRQTLDGLLFESLCHVLIEKGVLTKNDALSVVQTVAQVKQGATRDGPHGAQARADLQMLRRLFTSFEALDGRSTQPDFSGGNILRLRPPLHGDEPEFPEAD